MSRNTTPSSRKGETITVAGVVLTHADRVVYPALGLTKRDLARYYESVAPWALPHLRKRPLVLVRCPQGQHRTCFYQKHVNKTMPSRVPRIKIEEKSGPVLYAAAGTLAHLVALIQIGVLELHTWGAKADRLARPDRITFDLDPGTGVGWPRIVAAARALCALLADLGLASFVKTSGGKGLHVVVPLSRRHTWDEVKAFSRAVAERFARSAPRHFTAKLAKHERKGRIFVDYLRNAAGATAVAAYSTRARAGAPVSTPIGWEELTDEMQPEDYTVTSVPRRLQRLRTDPWAAFATTRQTLTRTMRRKLGLA